MVPKGKIASEGVKCLAHLLAVVLDGTCNAAAADLGQGEVSVEGGHLVGVLPVAQPRHLPQRHRQLRRRLCASCSQNKHSLGYPATYERCNCCHMSVP